jgi:hypothetical protein
VWPASLEIDQTDRLALSVFLETFGGTEASNLYRRFIDSTTRTEDLGASATFAFTQFQLGQPIYMGVEGVKADHLDEATGRLVRQRITEDLGLLRPRRQGARSSTTSSVARERRSSRKRATTASSSTAPPSSGSGAPVRPGSST